ncbi:hypothetical protein LLH03_19240 [bacterium]|nr:hypothetical protein [bacterium]
MITAVLITGRATALGPKDAIDRLRDILRKSAAVVELDSEVFPGTTLGSMVVDMIVLEAQHLTHQTVELLDQVRTMYPESTTVCAASEEVAERARVEGALSPDFWVLLSASDLQMRTQVEAIMAYLNASPRRCGAPSANHLAPSLSSPAGTALAAVAQGSVHSMQRTESALYRMVGRVTGSCDTEDLLGAYCDAVHEMTQCVNYCLLWQDANAREFRIARSEGMPPVVEEMCHMSLTDPLPTWLLRNRGVLTRDALAQAPEGTAIQRDLDMLGGVVAIPLFSQSVLRGFLAVGPKVLGTPYQPSEAEALFVLSANAAAGARQTELHRELEARNNYIDQVLWTMESGIVTINLEAKVCVCNPNAARVLRLKQEGAIGRDLRVLPSPLGDYLYSCLTYGEERNHEELAVLGGQVLIRVSTRRLLAPQGALMGAMLLVEDTAAERALARERRKAERNEVIGQMVARFAHELKNPLATIHTFAELLPTRMDDPEFQHFWSQQVMHDVHRLDDLVAKLVSLSEPPPSRRQTVNLVDVVRMAVDRVVLLDPEATQHIITSIDGGLPSVQVDADVMATALSHLLRYGLGRERRAVVVDARLQDGPKGEQPVAIYVRADGRGAPTGEPLRLLDPSYVLDHPDIDLGPSASQRLIESQGGALEAYCEAEDIVFRVSLIPVHELDDERAEVDRRR